MNPYLAMAASIGAGLLGIENNLSLQQAPIQGNGYECKVAAPFASNLRQAAEIFAASEAANGLLGERFVKHFSETRLWEWEQSQRVVTDWELRRYFEII